MSDRSGMSQPSLSRILPQVIEAILHVLSRRYISYPFTADEQIICDARMQLLNVCSKWPGSTHDSFILRHSRVGLRLEAGESGDGWLLGDRGYPLKTWLLTPFADPRTAEELCYNLAHGRTRSVVERTIGLLKGRTEAVNTRPVDVDADGDGPSTTVAEPSPSLLAPAGL
ncbi:hypothetical protein SKAU_G00231480 [Synaphobranchus kaupii]|uniref:DDE Tnp4 domain-containing protein n=1 Tax=Synaphobranchus kaupii TaxID=118154 RepID=A0A9Q1IT09_SYNKA|nr:hypothetical protein SKAU_G00231480 [Synaphobranchus kaupii]